MPGIMPDADTRALYKFDEASVPGTGYATAVDAGAGTRNLTETVPSPGSVRDGRYTHIVNGPNGNRYARWFPGNVGVYLSRNGDATVRAMFVGSWSFECWIRPDVLSGQQDILQYGGLDDVQANNHLFSFFLNGSTVQMFWEHGAGVNDITVGTGMTLTAGVWSHVAITCDNSGATSTLKFYLDGVLKHTASGVTKADGGTNTANFWRVGVNVNGSNAFRGAIKDVRFSTVVRSAATITADAAIANCQHPLDANTLVLWRFNEAPDAIDETDYGYHARKMQGSIEISEPLVDDNGLARHLSADTEYAAHAQYEAFRSMFLGNWTWDGWFRMDTGYALADRGWWIFGVSGVETEADNTVATDIMSTANGRQFRCWVEKGLGLDPGGGTDTGITSTDPLLDAVADGYNRHHIAVTKTQNGVDTEWRLYLDGALVEMQTSPFANNYTGGTGASNMLRMGAGGAAGFSGGLTTNVWLGSMDNMRWTARALTADEIAEVFEGTPPTIALSSPAEGTLPSVNTSIVVDFTDDTFIATGTARIVLDDGSSETLWQFFDPSMGVSATEFPAPYTGSSKAAHPTEEGWRVTFVRTGGWPLGAFTLEATASDGSLGDAAEFDFSGGGTYSGSAGTGQTGLPKLESHIRVPTGGWTLKLTEVGGGGTVSVLIPEGTYFPNVASVYPAATDPLRTKIADLLNASALSGTYYMYFDDDYDGSTGRTIFGATGITSFSIHADTTDALLEALGFTGTQSGALEYVSANSCRHIYLPDVGLAPAWAPEGEEGLLVSDVLVSRTSSMHSRAVSSSFGTVNQMAFYHAIASKVWERFAEDVVVNSSWQVFWRYGIGRGRRIAIFPDRADDAEFTRHRVVTAEDMRVSVAPETADWTSSAISIWNIGPLDLIGDGPVAD